MSSRAYIIVRSHDIENLIERVNNRIEEGYRPWGSLIVHVDGKFLQPMIYEGWTDAPSAEGENLDQYHHMCPNCSGSFTTERPPENDEVVVCEHCVFKWIPNQRERKQT